MPTQNGLTPAQRASNKQRTLWAARKRSKQSGFSSSHLYHERRYVDPLEQVFPFFYTTHSITAIVMIVLPLTYIALIDSPTPENVASIATYYCLYVYFILACMIFPSGPFVRPHPVCWRLVFACSLLYAFVLMILIIVPPMQARQLLKLVDPSLGQPITLPLYAEDCSLTYTNIKSKLDRFVLAHSLGWLSSGLLIRHRVMLWSVSIMWEFIEISTSYYIPNFAECWWDQWILDVLICNGLGIELGLLLCKYLEHQTYEWCEIFDERSIINKSCHFFKLFQPKTWTKVKWEAGSSLCRFMHVLLMILCLLVTHYNAFLMKLYLWIPTEHWLNLARLVWMTLMITPAVRQYYFYVTDDNVRRMGSQSTILFLIVLLETLLVYKTAPDDIPHAPFINKVCWAISMVVFVLFSFLIVRKFEAVDDEAKEGKKGSKRTKVNKRQKTKKH